MSLNLIQNLIPVMTKEQKPKNPAENYKPLEYFPPAAKEIFCIAAFSSYAGTSFILFSLAPTYPEDLSPAAEARDKGLPLVQSDEFRVWSSLDLDISPGDYAAIADGLRTMIKRLIHSATTRTSKDSDPRLVCNIDGNQTGKIDGKCGFFGEIKFYSNFNKSLGHSIIASLEREAKGKYSLRLKLPQLTDLDDDFFTLRSLIARTRPKIATPEKVLQFILAEVPNMRGDNIAELQFGRGGAGRQLFALLYSIALWEIWLAREKIQVSRSKQQRFQH